MSEELLNIESLKVLIESFPIPALIFDGADTIILHNIEAEKFLGQDLTDQSILDIIPADIKSNFKEMVDKQRRDNLSVKEVMDFNRKGKKNKIELVLKPLTFNFENYYLLTVNEKYFQDRSESSLSYCFPEKIEKTLSKEILSIIEEIKTSFPFTYIGKEKIQSATNKIGEMFWIKDPEGKYVLTNNQLASLYKMKPIQLEGKDERYFLPAYLVEFQNTINNYIKNTLNCFITEGIPVKGIFNAENYTTIEIPLIDSDNQLQAVIGIGKQLEVSSYKTVTEEDNEIPIAFMLINKKGEIQKTNKKMLDLLHLFDKNINGEKINEYFLYKTVNDITDFIDSGSESIEITGKLKKTSDYEQSDNYNIKIVKIVSNFEDIINYFLTLEKESELDEIERIIRKRGKMFDVLIKKNPDPIFIYDIENLRFLEVNESALNLYGFSRDEFLKMDLTDLYSPEDIQTLLDDNIGDETEIKFKGPYKHKRKDGSNVHVEIYKNSFKYQGRDAHFNIIRDVSANIEKERDLQVFRAIFENTDNLVFTTDDAGFIQFINPPVQLYLNYTSEDMYNSTFVSLLEETDRTRINSLVFNSRLNDPFNATLNLKKKDGSFVKCAVTISPVIDLNGETISYSIIGKPEEHVVEKIVEVKTEVEKPVVQTQAADFINPQVLTTIFHEILTPINVILGFVQEIKDSVDNPNEEQVEAINFITQNRVQLLEVMNSVAEYSQVSAETGDLNITEGNFVEIFETVNKELKENTTLLKEKEFLFGKLSSSLMVKSDLTYLKNFLYVLAKASFKISPHKELYVSAYQYDEDNFIISFKDDISDISERLLKTLNVIFTSKEVSIVREFGLSRYSVLAAKKLLGILQGKLEIVKKSGNDSEFGFIFPIVFRTDSRTESEIEEKEAIPEVPQPKVLEEVVAKGKTSVAKPLTKDDIEIPKVEWKSKKEAAPQKEIFIEPEVVKQKTATVVEEEVIIPEIQPEATKKKKELEIPKLSCLYIEDQVDSQILFKVQMKELKDMKFAVSFEEALPLITSNQFDFIVMDINLQGEYNGLDALKMIRQMPLYTKLPIIAVTAYVLPGDKEKFVAAGFDDFISKPIFREKMIESLEKIFT